MYLLPITLHSDYREKGDFAYKEKWTKAVSLFPKQ